MAKYDRKTHSAKASEIAENEGFDTVLDYAQSAITDSVSMGICLRDGCSYTTEVEPDCHDGYCEECGSSQVTSFVELFMLTA